MPRLLALLALILALVAGALPALAQNAQPNGQNGAPRLGPGDILQIVLPGEEAFATPFPIDREGRVTLPEAGEVILSGLTVAQARERVRAALAPSFRDLGRLNVILRERRLLVTVGGFVRTPGSVELPANSNVQMAIAAAGGLTAGAQLDRVQVRRGTQTITFDYKRYLDTGDDRILPALRSLDAVFVPASPMTGNVEVPFDARTLMAAGDAAEDRNAVRVFGEVNQAGTFAHRQGMTVMDALMRAGGVTRYAGTEQIRIISGGEPRPFNLKAFLDTGDARLNPPVAPGTTIFIPAQTEEVRQGPRVVFVMGEVQRPGAFEMRAGSGFFDVLANAGGPSRFAETRQLRIIRADGRRVEQFDLGGFIERGGGIPPTINPGDAIFIPEKTQGGEQASWLRVPPDRSVRVLGAVRAPGRFEWSDEMSLLDLLAQAGGANERGDLANVQVLPNTPGARTIRFDLRRFLETGGSVAALPRIRGGMTVNVPELPQSPTDSRAQWVQLSADRSIYVMGAVGKPGRYAFEENLSFLDILSAADGPTNAADILNIRIAHRGEGRDRVSRVNLARFFETGDETLLPRVRPGDVIFIPDRNRNWLEQSPGSTIRVLGSVNRPGRYQFTDGMTILDLLAEAGGPNRDALQERIVVVNLSCCADQARSFDLPAFARSGDVTRLPVVRAGDTVYVPTSAQSDWRLFFDGVRDIVTMLSVVALLGRI
jgi:protein involved in polysaccharide export with SLBB domain